MSTQAVKTAYQMFIELGFKKSTHGTLIVYERKADLIEDRIVFDKLMKGYNVQSIVGNCETIRSYVGMESHKAIHQQLLELGWIK